MTNNTFEFVFCEKGCVMTNELEDGSHPTYIEFYNNTYSDIYGLKGAVIHLQIDH